MKILAPSLALLAGACLTPTLSAAHVEDQDLKLSLVLNLQPRVEVANASDASGGDFDVQSGATGEPDTADFYLRRLRTGIKGSYQDHWKFAGIINADDAGRRDQSTRALTVHQAYVGYEFGEDAIAHLVQGGLDYAFFNHATASNSSALFPIQRASAELMPVRGLGVAYRLSTPLVRFGVDAQNNTGDDGLVASESEGLVYTGRIEITGPGDLALGKFQETYLNKEGIGFIVGIEAGINQDDRNAANTSSATSTVYGIDVVFHLEGLNALAEYRMRNIETEPDVGPSTEVDADVLIVQAGYAFAAGPVVLEPAVRYQIIDLDDENEDETLPYFVPATATTVSKDYGRSGNEIDIGLNCYFNGHGNKMSLAYSMWEAEDGDADANIVRLQHQLNF